MSRHVAIEASPASILESMRGTIDDARLAYPAVLHLEVRDESGATWRFSTQDAEWSPKDPGGLIGRIVTGVHIGKRGQLTLELGGGELFSIFPAPHEAPDDPPSWELITPDGLHLEFGPGLSWRIESADSGPAGQRPSGS